MPWTPDQLPALYANVYALRFTCPSCGGALAVTRLDRPDAFAEVRCAACDAEHTVAPATDPLRDRFREYTDAEKKAIFAADRAHKVPACPVDGTPMDVNAQRSLGRNSNVTARCRRCGRRAEFVRWHG